MSRMATARKAGAYVQTTSGNCYQKIVRGGQVSTVQPEPSPVPSFYLGIEINFKYQEVKRGSEVVSLAGSKAQWILMCDLYEAVEFGCTRDELVDSIWRLDASPDKSNCLDQAKKSLNAKLEVLKVEVVANMRGVWILREFGLRKG